MATDLEQMQGMLTRAGIPFTAQEIEIDQPNPRPGGTDLTMAATASGQVFVLGFNAGGELDDIELW